MFRLGKYEEGAQRPMKIRFKSQSAAEAIVGKAWRLSKAEAFKNIWVRKDRSGGGCYLFDWFNFLWSFTPL